MAIETESSGGGGPGGFGSAGGSESAGGPARPRPTGRPGPLGPGVYEIDPTNAGTRVKPRLVRNSPISTSGFGPDSRRRNIFITTRRLKNMDVLLWSDIALAIGASVSAGAPSGVRSTFLACTTPRRIGTVRSSCIDANSVAHVPSSYRPSYKAPLRAPVMRAMM